MEALIQKIPGVPAPIKKSLPHSYADSPFVDSIALVEMPRKFSFPNMKIYDGTTDPTDHIASYKQRMFTAAIPREQREACMCKKQFASSKKLEKLSGDLYRIQQRRTESLRDYVGRFNREKVSIPFCNQETAADAFRKGLLPDEELYKDLTKFNCSTMEDALARAWTEIRWEEDELHRTRRAPSGDSRSEEKRLKRPLQGTDKRSTSRPTENYTSNPRRRLTYDNRRPLERPASRPNDRPAQHGDRARIPEYTLNVEPIECVAIMKNMGTTVKWPRKSNNPDPKRDVTKYCEYHGDYGHSTPDCISLRFEVADLLKRGHLQDLLSDKGKNTLAQREARRDEQPKEPTPERVINVITGGSEVSGITYSAARRHARAAVNPENNMSPTPQTGASNLVLSFIDNEDSTLINPHHDALVISLLIANCRIKRILIDNGSSTNVIFLSALKEMNIDEAHIHRRSTVLVGFSGEQKFTLGDITLPVYAAESISTSPSLCLTAPQPTM
ncbi:hypothetical protein UlMin_027870 [Ulmus minor]